MLNKLAFRNMKRSARDYLVYIFTMTMAAALMYAFNGLLFQNELTEYFDTDDTMKIMIVLATIFIVLIIAWLINYMVRFMLEKRSSEFGIYLLLGMQKKMISGLYIRENILLGAVAFVLGITLGVLFQQVLLAIMYSMVKMEYHLQLAFRISTFLVTLFCYACCYLRALLGCRRKFKKMNIYALMNVSKQNEEIKEKHEEVKQILLPLSVIFIFTFWKMFGSIDSTKKIILFLIGLVITVYLFYMGLSATIICYIRRKGDGIYKGHNLFLFRQFASKVRTMQFTMGTLTALFTLALMGASFAFMFSDFENTMLEDLVPFDVQIYSADAEDDFADEIRVITENTEPLDIYPYYIYTDHGNQVNTWMLTHLQAFGTIYQNEDGSPDMEKIEIMLRDNYVYYACDTYMGLSDYNHLRGMLGYEEIALGTDEYALHTKPRLREEMQNIGTDLYITGVTDSGILSLSGIYAEPFSQNGHNGADYVIVVPDAVLGRMVPYYSELTADIDGRATTDLQYELTKLPYENGFTYDANEEGNPNAIVDWLPGESKRIGSDVLMNISSGIMVKDILIPEAKYMLAAFMIPLFYIGLVFVCVAMTVLSVQQLSDSAKYKFRYDILAKLGLNRTEIHSLIGKQLIAFYLCPAILALAISGRMILFASDRFVFATGILVPAGSFFARSIALFFGIYLIYFAITYTEFTRNVDM